jgi:signal transduction histidine kinase
LNQSPETVVLVKSTPLASKIAFALVSLLALFSLFGGIIAFNASQDHEQKLLQSLSKDLAKNVVDNWPDVMASSASEGRIAERNAILSMLMVVNPTIQVYVLDDSGKVLAFINTARELQTHVVDLKPIEHFLQNDMFPIRGTDPLNAASPRIFSAARFTPARSHWPALKEPSKQGYLYILINSKMQKNGNAVSGVANHFGSSLTLLILAFVVTSIGGYLIVKKLTERLGSLAKKMALFQRDEKEPFSSMPITFSQTGDEIAILENSFATMTTRLEVQRTEAERISFEHREVMAGVAHDLRVPLTALHGNLEALNQRASNLSMADRKVLQIALDQSDRVRALSQELFELAALELTDQIVEFEWFSLDDLVGDIVQKFKQLDSSIAFSFELVPPKTVKIKANIHLIERAITNLIDNAMKHGKSTRMLCIDVKIDAMNPDSILVSVGDNGIGFSAEILERLSQGSSLRTPPLKRAASTIGGRGLAVSQRIRKLHDGKLSACNRPDGGGLISIDFEKRSSKTPTDVN